MPRPKSAQLRDFPDGWRGIISEAIDRFERDDPEGFRRLDELGWRTCVHSKPKKFKSRAHCLFGSLGRIAFEPFAAKTNLGQDLLMAIAEEFEATVNFLEYCRQYYFKMIRNDRGRAELALTGQILHDSLAAAGRHDLKWRQVHELFPLKPALTKTGVKNARAAILRRRRKVRKSRNT